MLRSVIFTLSRDIKDGVMEDIHCWRCGTRINLLYLNYCFIALKVGGRVADFKSRKMIVHPFRLLTRCCQETIAKTDAGLSMNS